MRNQGPEAYRPEDFGHTIVVERTISATVRAPPPAGRRFHSYQRGPPSAARARLRARARL